MWDCSALGNVVRMCFRERSLLRVSLAQVLRARAQLRANIYSCGCPQRMWLFQTEKGKLVARVYNDFRYRGTDRQIKGSWALTPLL